MQQFCSHGLDNWRWLTMLWSSHWWLAWLGFEVILHNFLFLPIFWWQLQFRNIHSMHTSLWSVTLDALRADFSTHNLCQIDWPKSKASGWICLTALLSLFHSPCPSKVAAKLSALWGSCEAGTLCKSECCQLHQKPQSDSPEHFPLCITYANTCKYTGSQGFRKHFRKQ